jgi:translocator protein
MLRLIIFLILNFSALALGAALMGGVPVNNSWYQLLNKAPWTPPGWIFGAAWFSIMLCFSFFMFNKTKDFSYATHKQLILLFAIQWILNVAWNPVFFQYHLMGAGLVIILLLTFLVAFFTWKGFQQELYLGLLMLPYLIWLIIATSLNAYALLMNE